MPIDQAAVIDRTNLRYIDPEQMAKVDLDELLDLSGKNGFYPTHPARNRKFYRYSPEFIDDPSKAELFPGLKSAVYTSPCSSIFVASNVAISGFRTVTTHENYFFDLNYGEPSGPLPVKFSPSTPLTLSNLGLTPNENDTSYRLDIGHRKIQHVEGCAISILSNEPSNYGSFLFRTLPKVIAIKKLGLANLPIITHSAHSSYVDALEMLGIDRAKIVNHNPANFITTVDRVLVSSVRNPHAFLDYESRSLFQDLAYSFGSPQQKGKVIYISRLSHAKAGGSTRVMLNEEELIDRLAKVGIAIVEPQKLSLDQQIKEFSSAEMVIGPSGGAMFNTVFCAPGTKIIDIESEPHWVYAHAGLFASSELRYGIFVGKQDPSDLKAVQRSWTIDINALIDRIRKFR